MVVNPVNVGLIISKRFSNLFNTYTQAFNKTYKRTGGLFETPFRRKKVTTNEYFTQLIYYIHFNPHKHGIIDDFREYPYSSYAAHLSNKATKLKREQVIQWFGDKEGYIRFHDIGTTTEMIEVEFLQLPEP